MAVTVALQGNKSDCLWGARVGVLPSGSVEPWGLSVPDAIQARCVLPGGGRWLGLGVADEWVLDEGDWCARVTDAMQAVVRRVLAVAGVDAPIQYCGGLAFDQERPFSPLGDQWPGAWWFLPRWILWQGEAGGPWHWAVVARGDTQQGLADVLADNADALNAWVSKGVAKARSLSLMRDTTMSEVTHDSWRVMVARVKAAIARGEVMKVVLARHESWRCSEACCPDSLAGLFDAIAQGAPGTTRILLARGGAQAVMMATPERLCRISGSELVLDALAGSAARDPDPATDARLADALLASAKDRHEHQLVIDGIREALGDQVAFWHYPPEPVIRTLPYIQHLFTPLQATLSQSAAIASVVAALHPTPALGGLPKAAALGCIRGVEAGPRGWYGAPVGVIGAKGAEFWVAIRFAHVFADRLALVMGAGIVDRSDADAEWLETERKGEALRATLRQWGESSHAC